MALLPEGFALPPLPYLAALAVSVLAVGAVLYRDSPPVTERTVVALAPWMITGSALYVGYQIGAVPAIVAPLFGSPAVYLTTFACLGMLWVVANRLLTDGNRSTSDMTDDPTPTSVPEGAGERATTDGSTTTATVLGVSGAFLALAVVTGVLAIGAGRGSLELFWPTVGLFASIVITAAAWLAIRRGQAGTTGWAGVLVVFAHTLDGVSTTVGVDVLGFGEQTPLARVFLELAQSLPVSGFLGTGWLFAGVKIALAVFVAWVLADSVRERPREGYLFCAFVAAVGLGPGAHNLLLFTVVG